MLALRRTEADRNLLRRAASHSFTPTYPRPADRAWLKFNLTSLVMVVSTVVYCLGASGAGAGDKSNAAGAKPPASAGWPISTPLPPAAEDMRQAIETAIHSGDIAELKVAYDLGELKADIADQPVTDPVAYWKAQSSDGEGREILAILANLFAVGAADVARGRDAENNSVYVWPYLAEVPLDKLSPAQKVDLLRLMPPAEAKAMLEKKTWTWWRLTIGADGLWHAFKKGS
ncbi:MAG: hypothetical protein Q7T86_11210 [Hyphomicrobiaceae bacterium]|nr:hypothetical protein [Hyphomicrobiaceae bacterium]